MEKPGAAAAARRRADDGSGIPPSTDAPPAPLCCDIRVTEGSHDGRKALAYFAVGTVLLLVVPDAAITWSVLGRPPAPQPWVSVALLGFACLGQLRSSTRPLLGLTVATAAMAISPLLIGTTHTAVILVFCDLLYCAVLHSARRAGWWVAGAAGSVLVTIALVNLVHFGPQAAVGSFLGLMVIFAVPVFWAHEVRQHRDRADAEHARADQERRLAELGRLAAVADERNRMARELHDVIAGQLSAIAIQSEAALTIPGADEATLRRVLAEVRRGSVASLAEMRTMIGLLRTDTAEEPRTAPARLDRIDALLDAGRATGLSVDLDDRRPPGDVPAAVDLAAYRIVQESLTNAAKHAPGSAVRCELRQEAGALHVQVVNDLVRDAPAGGGTGTGLLGLGERAAAVGGHVDAGPRDGTWTVRAALPIGGGA